MAITNQQIYDFIINMFGYLAIILIFVETIFAGIIIRQVVLLDKLLKTGLAPFLKLFTLMFFTASVFTLLYAISIFIF